MKSGFAQCMRNARATKSLLWLSSYNVILCDVLGVINVVGSPQEIRHFPAIIIHFERYGEIK